MTTTLPASKLNTHLQHGDGVGSDNDISRRQNAFSNRLTSILSSSFADSEVREALRLADARRTWTEDVIDIDLKHEAQKEVIEANARIVEDFSHVAKQLKRVGTLISTLNQTCDEMRKHILAAKQETAPMLDDASTLLAQKQETETKQQLLNAFNQHFLVSDEDLATLTNSAEPVNNHFFSVLGRVKQIHKDCEILLGYENQRLGLELMEQTSRNLDAGYKKLYTWTQREFKGLDLEDPQISGSIRRSLRALSERPALFQNCLDYFAEARQNTLAEAFRTALTGSSLDPAKAIDFSTHDPLRYIGDMLAWVHSATVSEMEALEGLFISDADEISRSFKQGKTFAVLDDPSGAADPESEIAFDGRAALNSLISRNMALVSQTLTQRINLTVRNLSERLEIYKAYNLLIFYHGMLTKLMGLSSKADASPLSNALLTTLTELQATTLHHFETTITEDFHTAMDDALSPALTPPQALTDNLALFVSCIATRGGGLNVSLAEFTKLYTTLLTPILTSCNDLAESATETHNTTARSCNPATIYRANYMALVRNTLQRIFTVHHVDVAKEPLRNVDNQVTHLTQSLSEEVSESFQRSSGLRNVSHRLFKAQADKASPAMTRRIILNADSERNGYSLEDLAGQLDTFLAHALADTQDELSKLGDKGIARTVVEAAVHEFIERFSEVLDALDQIDEEVERSVLVNGLKGQKDTDDVDGEDDEEDDGEQIKLRDVYVRTVEEVEALLS